MARTAFDEQLALLAKLTVLVKTVEPLKENPAVMPTTQLVDIIGQLERPTQKLPYADDDELHLELVRTLELHGEGLRPYADDVEYQPGDLVLASDRSAWIVVAVRDDGRIKELAGATTSKRRRVPVLWWRPTSAARRWVSKDTAPAYNDVDKALVHLIRLWGESTSDRRDIHTPVGFFLEIADAPGLKVLRGALNEFADHEDVAQFCQSRGGLTTLAGGARLTPGDVVCFRKGKAWGVVTRQGNGGSIGDILVGGMRAKGTLGERATTVKLLRDVSGEVVDALWRPARKAS